MNNREFRALLGLGSNVGDRVRNIEEALGLLRRIDGIEIHKVSGLYETAAEFFESQPDFLNCAVSVTTTLQPLGLLLAVKSIETRMGRKENFRYAPRIIDIDILLYENITVEGEDLSIPHCGLEERLFVLFPLAEIAGEAVHPVSGRSVDDILRIRLCNKR